VQVLVYRQHFAAQGTQLEGRQKKLLSWKCSNHGEVTVKNVVYGAIEIHLKR
jgi:hypothetical protein